ncbi:MAG: hypothetical protein R6X19_08095 [Kiritimatiellia bacterium]
MKKISITAALALALLFPLALPAAQPASTLLVVPARLRMVQLAFDMQSLRNAEVVSWRVTEDPEAPELNYWTGREWRPLTLAEFRSGARLARKPQKVIFMGLETPAVLEESTDFPPIARFETFDPAMLVNNLDAFYSFSAGEWKLLSKRYGFMLRDVNARVREQNRYATPPPREPGQKRTPVKFDKNPPAAEVVKPAATVGNIPPASVEAPAVKADEAPAGEPAK